MTSPTERRDQSDPGDQVIRKFRYQHAYGAILAIAMLTGQKPYNAIWCEQHEDLLAERNDGTYDAYQVKTRKSELGQWEINNEAFFKSVARFVALDQKFPQKIHHFYFVSNTEYSDSNAEKRKHLSPFKLLRGVSSVTTAQDVTSQLKEGFDLLVAKTGANADALFSVLKRLDLVVGPTERAYEDEICQRHIPKIPQCKSVSVPVLEKLRESLISLMGLAASLYTSDPSRDWVGLISEESRDPRLLSKRVTIDSVTLAVAEASEHGVRFSSDLGSLCLGALHEKHGVLQKKLIRAGLAARYETMRRRAITAEQDLLERATRQGDPDQELSQIENIVLGECDDANLRASVGKAPWGATMLIDVQERLKQISENNPRAVCNVPYEALVGVAGLLTSECKVWWSEEFDLEEDK